MDKTNFAVFLARMLSENTTLMFFSPLGACFLIATGPSLYHSNPSILDGSQLAELCLHTNWSRLPKVVAESTQVGSWF